MLCSISVESAAVYSGYSSRRSMGGRTYFFHTWGGFCSSAVCCKGAEEPAEGACLSGRGAGTFEETWGCWGMPLCIPISREGKTPWSRGCAESPPNNSEPVWRGLERRELSGSILLSPRREFEDENSDDRPPALPPSEGAESPRERNRPDELSSPRELSAGGVCLSEDPPEGSPKPTILRSGSSPDGADERVIPSSEKRELLRVKSNPPKSSESSPSNSPRGSINSSSSSGTEFSAVLRGNVESAPRECPNKTSSILLSSEETGPILSGFSSLAGNSSERSETGRPSSKSS